MNIILEAVIALMITTAAPKIDQGRALKYAEQIVKKSATHGLNPAIVVAVAWHESNFRILDRNSTNDYGILQVHWYPGSPWLRGLTRKDLLDPRTNITAGIHELAWWKGYHEKHCRHKADGHHWVGHYRWGVRVKNRKYGKSIKKKKEILLRVVFND